MSSPDPGTVGRLLAAVASGAITRRRLVVVLASGLAVLFAAAALLGLEPSSGTSALVPRAADASAATDRIRAKFGDDSIVVMAQGRLQDVLLSPDLGRLLALEGCLGGRIPKGAKPYGGDDGPCARIAKGGAVKRVYGPATFLNEAARQLSGQVGDELEKAVSLVTRAKQQAREQALAQGLGEEAAKQAAEQAGAQAQREAATRLARLQVQTGLRGLPSIANSDFVSQVVFDAGRGVGEPKARFAYLFPSANSALIQVKPVAGLNEAQRRLLAKQVREATGVGQFRLKAGRYRVTGAPVLADSLADEVAAGALPLLIAAAIAMALALGMAFRVPFRLLALAVALVTACVVFGAMGIGGLSLTVAAVGGIPVLIGLAVDYAVQFQARAAERRRAGEDAEQAVLDAASAGGPPIVAAALATSAGFVALLLSPVPMVRGFGLVLVAGVAVAVIVAFTLGSALISTVSPGGRRSAAVADSVDASVRGAGEILRSLPGAGRAAGLRVRARDVVRARPRAVLVAAVVVAVAGWAVESSIGVESDVARLVPSGTPALSDLEALRSESGVAGEVDVLVSGDRALDPATLKWLRQFRADALRRWGFDEQKGCKGASLCPGVAVTDIIPASASARQTKQILEVVPEYFRSAVVSDDRKSVVASFGVDLLPLERQQEVFDDLRARARTAPTGLEVVVGGLPVIAAEANSRLADPLSRLKITAAALALVALVLLLTLRSFRRAAIPLAATVVATGWANFGLWLFGVELNPLSAALGALVIAIATEFAVLLSERERSERLSGEDPGSAMDRALGTTGRAIAVSGLTVVSGFAVLGLSDIKVLRDFGFATVIDLVLALAAVTLVVPAIVRWRSGTGGNGEDEPPRAPLERREAAG